MKQPETSQDVRYRAIMRQVKSVECFVVDGDIFRGDGVAAISKFSETGKHPDQFVLWVRDNYNMLGVV